MSSHSVIVCKSIPGGPQNGDLWCTHCGQTYNFNSCLPAPCSIAEAIMTAWGKDHRRCIKENEYDKYVNHWEEKYFDKEGKVVQCSKPCQPDIEQRPAAEIAPTSEK